MMNTKLLMSALAVNLFGLSGSALAQNAYEHLVKFNCSRQVSIPVKPAPATCGSVGAASWFADQNGVITHTSYPESAQAGAEAAKQAQSRHEWIGRTELEFYWKQGNNPYPTRLKE